SQSELMESGPSGVFAASLTPMTADLEIDHKRLMAHGHWLLANGCDGLAPLGTTGEANSLSVDERMAVLDAYGQSDIPGDCLIPGVGSCAIPDAVRLIRRCLEMGAAGCLMLPPFYYKGVSDDGLFAAFSETIQRVGDSKLRLYLYNFPQQVGFPLSQELVTRLVKAYPDTVVGMKDSSGDWDNMAATLKNNPGFRLLPGSEEFLLKGLRAGAVGCISATVNVTAALSGAVFTAWQHDGNAKQVDALQDRLTAARKAFAGPPVIPALKGFLAAESGDTAWLPCRPPNMALSAADVAALQDRLKQAGFRLSSLPQAA
ncbi:MAG: dihydrodipicolinate synthase family protein, partial [Alphaproteobacteria bacterium]